MRKFRLPKIRFNGSTEFKKLYTFSNSRVYQLVYVHLYGSNTRIIEDGIRNQLIVSYELPLVHLSSLERLNITESILEELE